MEKMRFRMYCPYCNNIMEAEEEWIGRAAECPFCGKKLVVEKPKEEPVIKIQPVSAVMRIPFHEELSTASIILLYLFMLFPCTSLITFIVCIVLCLSWKNTVPEKARQLFRHTIAAFCIALAILIFTPLVFAIGFFPVFNASNERARKIACVGHMRQIMVAIKIYGGDNQKHFPDQSGIAGLEILRKENYIGDSRIYICPSSGMTPAAEGRSLSDHTVSYIYIGGFGESGHPDQAILFCTHHEEHVYIGCIDGSIRSFFGKDCSTIRGTLKRAGIFRQMDKLSPETQEYIRKLSEE